MSDMPDTMTWMEAFNHPNERFNLPNTCPCGKKMKVHTSHDYDSEVGQHMVLMNECQCKSTWYCSAA